MKTLVVFPGAVVRSYIRTRSDLIYLDEKGWWVLEGTCEPRLVDVFSIPVDLNNTDHVAITKRLNDIGPIWARWVAHSDQREMLLREALIYVLHVKAGLERFGVTKVIFHTSASHHIDSNLVEAACVAANIPQIFLYFNVVTNRLHPLIQRKSIADRKPLGAIISKYEAFDDIKLFIQNKRKGAAPIHNTTHTKIQRSPIWAITKLIYMSMKGAVRDAAARILRSDKSFFDQFPNFSFADHLRLILNQKSGLEYYDRNCIADKELEQIEKKSGNVPSIIIAAHFQPESTSFPEGGDLNNHIDIVLELRKIGYEGKVLYKEHKVMYVYTDPIVGQHRIGVFRSVPYYKRLLALGCVFVNTDVSLSLDSNENYWYLPLTITGSIGVERSLGGYNTLYAGHPWYKGIPGGIPVRDAGDAIKSGSVTRYSKEVAEEAFSFLENMLSFKTIINAPGIGSGIPEDDPQSLKVFTEEMDALIEYLNRT